MAEAEPQPEYLDQEEADDIEIVIEFDEPEQPLVKEEVTEQTATEPAVTTVSYERTTDDLFSTYTNPETGETRDYSLRDLAGEQAGEQIDQILSDLDQKGSGELRLSDPTLNTDEGRAIHVTEFSLTADGLVESVYRLEYEPIEQVIEVTDESASDNELFVGDVTEASAEISQEPLPDSEKPVSDDVAETELITTEGLVWFEEFNDLSADSMVFAVVETSPELSEPETQLLETKEKELALTDEPQAVEKLVVVEQPEAESELSEEKQLEQPAALYQNLPQAKAETVAAQPEPHNQPALENEHLVTSPTKSSTPVEIKASQPSAEVTDSIHQAREPQTQEKLPLATETKLEFSSSPAQPKTRDSQTPEVRPISEPQTQPREKPEVMTAEIESQAEELLPSQEITTRNEPSLVAKTVVESSPLVPKERPEAPMPARPDTPKPSREVLQSPMEYQSKPTLELNPLSAPSAEQPTAETANDTSFERSEVSTHEQPETQVKENQDIQQATEQSRPAEIRLVDQLPAADRTVLESWLTDFRSSGTEQVRNTLEQLLRNRASAASSQPADISWENAQDGFTLAINNDGQAKWKAHTAHANELEAA